MVLVRWLACVGIASASIACEPAKPSSHASRTSPPGASAAPAREPTFASQRSKPVYDRAREEMRAIDALRGSPVTEALATDLGFKCADLKTLRKDLEAEPDPVVWRLRTDIDKTCSFDAPIASALFEVARIERKRAGDPGAKVDGECRMLKLAIEDIGTRYIANPMASGVIDKELMYCESTDVVRRVQ